MKRICIIRSNPVRPDSRVEKEAWTLSKAGYDVHILAWDRDSDHSEQNGTIVVADREISITWLGYKAEYGAGRKSLKPFMKFQMHIRKWLKKHINEYDAVHACDFDTAYFSMNIVKRHHKAFVYDIFDFLYGEPKSSFQRTIQKSQFNIINKADATIICTEERKEQIAGSKPVRLCVIHNTPFKAQMDDANNGDFRFKSDTEKIKIAYVGILAGERLLTQIANCIVKHPEIEFHIGGFGYLEKHFIQLEKEHDNIFFYGRIPYSHALQMEEKCDIMTAIYDPSDENCRRAAPNKFYESLMLGKPVLMARNTGMSKVVEENNVGELIEFSEAGFEKGLKALIDRKNEWNDMSERMKRLYQDSFSWEEMDKRLCRLYSDLF